MFEKLGDFFTSLSVPRPIRKEFWRALRRKRDEIELEQLEKWAESAGWNVPEKIIRKIINLRELLK